MKHKLHFDSENDDAITSLIDDADIDSIENSALLYDNDEDFDPSISKISAFALNPSSSMSIVKCDGCELLPGSFLEANNLFGMDINRVSHIQDIENKITEANKLINNIILENNNKFENQKTIYYKKGKLSTNNDKTISKSLKKPIKYECANFAIEKTSDNEDILIIQINDDQSTIIIESDTPIEIRKCPKEIGALRLISPSIYLNSEINVQNFEVITNVFESDGEVNAKSFILRSKEAITNQMITGNQFIFIGTEVEFKSSVYYYESMFVSAKSKAIFNELNNSLTFIYSPAITIKNSFTASYFYAKSQNITINKTASINSTDIVIESFKLTNKGTIVSEKKICLLLLHKKDHENIFINEGRIKTYDLLMEANNIDIGNSDSQAIMSNKSALTVTNAFLLSNGIFNTKNTAIRSLYISAFCSFKCTGELSVGDLIVVEKQSEFVSSGSMKQYATLRPVILVSGSFECKSELIVKKFVCSGTINGSLLLDSSDIVSISGNGELNKIDIKSNHISISERAGISASNVILHAKEISIGISSLRPVDDDSSILIKSMHDIEQIKEIWPNYEFEEVKFEDDKPPQPSKKKKKLIDVHTPVLKKE